MSLLDKIYGKAKGVDSGLSDMNKNLERMRQEDKEFYKTEKSYRNQVQTQAKRERQDRARLHTNVAETIQKASAANKASPDSKTMGILTTALAAVVVGVLAAKGLKPKKKKDTPSSQTPAGGGTPEKKPDKTETLKGLGSSAFSAPPPKFQKDTPGIREEVIDVLESYRKEQKEVNKRTVNLEKLFSTDAAKPQGFRTGGFTGMVPNMGQPAEGDHFYTHVDPGSYIMNRELVKGLGYQEGGAPGSVPVALERGEIALPPGSFDQNMMDFLNYQAFPRFQKGGKPRKDNGAPSEDSVMRDMPKDLSKIMGFKKGGKIFLHWAGSRYTGANDAYHATIQGDGKPTKTRDYNKFGGGHTSERNSEGIGLSVAAMHGASTHNFGRYPVKTKQWNGLAKLTAKIAKSWGWDSGDINASNIITHAEAGRQGDSRGNYGPVAWGGDGSRWDLWKLYEKDSNGSGGSKIRSMIKQAMSGTSGAQAEKDNQELAQPQTQETQSDPSDNTGEYADTGKEQEAMKEEANMGFGSGVFGQLMSKAIQGAAGLLGGQLGGIGASGLAAMFTAGSAAEWFASITGLGGGNDKAGGSENLEQSPAGTQETPGPTPEPTQQAATPTATPTPNRAARRNRDISTSGLKKANHGDTGAGWSPGADRYGRPVVLSKPAAAAFARMMSESGGAVTGGHVSSSQRSRSKNSAVGGHPNSYHLYGEAVDVIGSTNTWMRQNGKKYGWHYGYSHGPGSAHYNYKGKRRGGLVGKYVKGGMPGSADTFLHLQRNENQHTQDYGGAPIVINAPTEPPKQKVIATGGHSNNLPQGLTVRCSSVFSANYRFDERSYNLAMYS